MITCGMGGTAPNETVRCACMCTRQPLCLFTHISLFSVSSMRVYEMHTVIAVRDDDYGDDEDVSIHENGQTFICIVKGTAQIVFSPTKNQFVHYDAPKSEKVLSADVT